MNILSNIPTLSESLPSPYILTYDYYYFGSLTSITTASTRSSMIFYSLSVGNNILSIPPLPSLSICVPLTTITSS